MKVIPFVLLLLFLNACAKPLQPDNYAERISSARLDHNSFIISYQGSTVTDGDRVVDLTLLKSAETTLQNGYNFFVIVATGESVKTAAYNSPENSNGQIDNYLQDVGYEPTVVGANTYHHADPGAINTIVCFKERPQGFAYAALFLKATLRHKYRLDRVSKQTAIPL
jgi:hypothetical protein